MEEFKMADQFHKGLKNKYLNGEAGPDLSAGVDAYLLGDSINDATDFQGGETLDDLDADGIIAGPVALTDIVITDNVFDAGNVTFTDVEAEHIIDAVLLVTHETVAGDGVLIDWKDQASGIPGIPGATNGEDVVIQWSNGDNKIFAL
jgi:hypothetical protein